jgi:hypothetical protein
MTEANSGAGSDPDRSRSQGHPGTPRWVKMSALVVAVLVVALVIAMLLAGGEHGPGRHAASLV